MFIVVPGTEDGSPPPAVVLRRQLEVGQGHRDTRRHTQQDPKHNKQDPVQRVLLTAPQRRKDVIQLHGDGTEIIPYITNM